MDELRKKVKSVEVAIQRELAYSKKLAELNRLPDEELIPLQVPNSISKSTANAVNQAAASEQPSANVAARSISSWNPNFLGERRPAPPNKGELSGVESSPMPFPRPNSGPMRETLPAQNSQEIPGGTASSNPSLLREKPPAMSNTQQLPAVNACPRPIADSNPNPRLLGGRLPTTSNNGERPAGYASSRPITSSNTSLAGQKRPAVPNNHELLMGNSSSRPSLIGDPLSFGVDQSVHSTQALQLQLVPPFSQNDTLMPMPDNLFCEVCKVQCSGRLNYKQHIKGRKHRSTIQELKFGIKDRGEDSAVGSQRARKWCSLCRVWCMNDDNMKMHLTGQKHKAEEDRLMLAQTGGIIENQKYCDLCGIGCADDRAFQKHFYGKRHKTEQRLRECRRKTGQNSKQRHCELCNISCPDERSLQSHLEGTKHALKVLQAKKSGSLVPVVD